VHLEGFAGRHERDAAVPGASGAAAAGTLREIEDADGL